MYVLWCCIELLVIEFVFCDSVVSFCFWHVCFVMLFSNVDKNIGGHRGLNWGMVKNQTQEHKTTLNARCVVKSKMMYGGNVPEPRCPFAVGLVATRPCFWLAAANLASSWRERRGGRRMLYRKTSNFPRFFTQLWTCWSSDARWISSKNCLHGASFDCNERHAKVNIPLQLGSLRAKSFAKTFRLGSPTSKIDF